MTHFGIGAEQFGIDAANWNIGIDSGNPFIVAATTDAIREQQEALAQQAIEPERQPDVVQAGEPETPPKADKRKYTKRK